jgi:hypothetical protein
MATQTTGTSGAVRYMQGIAVPSESVQPAQFFARTRRHTANEGIKGSYAGLGMQDIWECKKSDVISGFYLRFSGSLVVTPGSGTVASTARWPYDMINARFTANGASNLINCSGLFLKAREAMAKTEWNDRGIAQTIGGSSVSQGTLSMDSESWGVGSNTTGLAAGTYPVDLMWYIPVAEDEIDLSGAIFAATSSTDLTVTVDYASQGTLFTTTGNGAVALTGSAQLTAVKYSIPLGADGNILVPDLSLFHSIIKTRSTNGLAVGENETRLNGQGAGKTLLRTWFNVWNGTTSAPLPMNDTNFGKLSWRYASNETPDEYLSGQVLRYFNERVYGVDIGKNWGIGAFDFAAENAFRDAVDMGTTSELRLVTTIASGVTLTNPAIEYAQETIFQAGAGS